MNGERKLDIYTVDYYSAIKKNEFICKKVGGIRDHDARGNKADAGGQIPHVTSRMWNLDNKNKHKGRRETICKRKGTGGCGDKRG
jgi:hypothetical protein